MTWAKKDDRAWNNEKLMALSHEAYRLYDVAVSFVASEWPGGAGCLSRTRAESLARLHRIDEPEEVIAELRTARLWEPRGHGLYHVHDIEKYMPPANLSAVRAEAGRKGGKMKQENRKDLAFATPLPEQNVSSGTPVPEPVSRVNSDSPLRSSQSAPLRSNGHAVVSNGTLVGYYVDVCHELGVVADGRAKGQIGREGKRLQDEGHDDDVLREAIAEAARTNHAELLGRYVGDIERRRAGVDTRRAPPSPSVNPIDARIAAMRHRPTVIEVPKRD